MLTNHISLVGKCKPLMTIQALFMSMGSLSKIPKTASWSSKIPRGSLPIQYYHFIITLLRNAQCKAGNYEYYSKALPTGKSFAAMGPYLRRSMLYALARKAGDTYTTFQDLIENAEETTFHTDHKLEDKEEDEIARRVLNTKGDGNDSEDDDDEEEGSEGQDEEEEEEDDDDDDE